MSDLPRQAGSDVEHLLRNAQLRDELEPYFDEAITRVDVQRLSTPMENKFLQSMLDWERAPVLPIAQWFDPPLQVPPPESYARDENGELALHEKLWETIHELFSQRITLDFTDHLSDRQLYTLIYRDILPAQEKRVPAAESYLHWDCADVGDDSEIWLTYYASEEDRQSWYEETGEALPEAQTPPYTRKMPQQPL
ncbi:MAG: hypothetical protein WD030_04980 [Pirellulales bacterium]